MGRDKSLSRIFCVAVAALALAGCAGDDDTGKSGEPAPNIVQPGAPGEPSRTLSEDELADLELTSHSEADVRFMQTMIHHHAQALLMTELAAENDAGRDVRLLAKRIDISQASEIDLMRNWLYDRYEPAPEAHPKHGHAHGVGFDPNMPGMVSQARLKALRSARGEEFDRLFLRSMIHHHRGALTMVAELYASGGGLESSVDAFARHVEADQQIEIGRMQALLAELRRD